MAEREETYQEERARLESESMARWAKRNAHHPTDRVRVQTQHGSHLRHPLHGGAGVSATVPRIVAEAAYEGYVADGHGGQSFETLHERGGFDLLEIGYYLARAVDEGRVRIEIVGKP